MASPQVGIGAMILDSSRRKIVFGKRKGSHGAGTWAIPGGHLEFGESFEECAAREVLEETGLVVRNVKFLTATNSVFREEGKHYVTIFVGCEISEGEGQVPVVSFPLLFAILGVWSLLATVVEGGD
ncbi:MAG: Nudix hydrolase 15, mitochondrial [Cirrosporium novae-zelandiae]|nr:MAG: Nudix hydrolase 15, mitochondrial [Cirrosporium novae-zelandiae]